MFPALICNQVFIFSDVGFINSIECIAIKNAHVYKYIYWISAVLKNNEMPYIYQYSIHVKRRYGLHLELAATQILHQGSFDEISL